MKEPNMLLQHRELDNSGTIVKTFQAIPITDNCPFIEVIYNKDNKELVIIHKNKKPMFHMLPKLDDNGEPIVIKGKNKLKQERKVTEMYYEYFIKDINDIETFINLVCINANSFDWKSLL